MTSHWKRRWFEAIREHKKLDVAHLLAHPAAHIDAHNDSGESALHIAVAQNDFVLSMFLLRRGAQVDIVNTRTNKTALMLAVERANVTMAYALLHHNASLLLPAANTNNANCFIKWLHKTHLKRTKTRDDLEKAILRAWRCEKEIA